MAVSFRRWLLGRRTLAGGGCSLRRRQDEEIGVANRIFAGKNDPCSVACDDL